MRPRSASTGRAVLGGPLLNLVLGLALVGCGTGASPATTVSSGPSASPQSPAGGSSSSSSATSASPSGSATSGSPSPGTSSSPAGSLAAGDPAHVQVDLETIAKGLEAPLGIASPSDG